MGKYMRKGKAAGKVALMEVLQGALGVRTRAKTLALVEQDRKLALAKSASSKHQQTSVIDPFRTSSYLELRSRKLEKVVKEIEKPVRGHRSREGSLNEDVRISPNVCPTRPEGEELPLHTEVVGSSRTPELSPRHVDGFQILKDFPIESALSTPRPTLEGAQLRCLESGAGEEPLLSGNVPPPERSSERSLAHTGVQGGVSPIVDGLSQDRMNYERPEVDVSCEYAASELGISSVRRRYFRGSSESSSSKNREVASDIEPGSSSRTGFVVDRQDRRMTNHHRIMNRRYMRTNLFSDAKAIDELFAAPDTADREEGRKFSERYNYDVVNDTPLKGRYEWVPAVEPRRITNPLTQHFSDQQQPIRS